jgi:uncharacterized protein DUF935
MFKIPSFRKKNLGAEVLPDAPKRKDTWNDKIQLKIVSQARQDMATWKGATRAALNVEMPRRARIQQLYDDIGLDALLTSQYENRKKQVVGGSFTLKDANGEINEDLTNALKAAPWLQSLLGAQFDSIMRGTTVCEFYNPGNGLQIRTINRRNVEPRSGMVLLDENDTSGIMYREEKEYGWWVLEFGDPEDLGLMNKAVPHVLFKRFAQSCWSELCEIYGIPPRYIKTNTQDTVMLSRAEQMMRDMGAAAWFIIDDTEELEFADGINTNGDVYKNLIKLCSNEISMLFSGAVIGQDTVNGNKSKEVESSKALGRLIEADKVTIEGEWGSMVMPALQKLGVLPEGLTFYFEPEEDLTSLWSKTKDTFQYFDVDPDWVKSKFGIEVTGAKKQLPKGKADQGFF